MGKRGDFENGTAVGEETPDLLGICSSARSLQRLVKKRENPLSFLGEHVLSRKMARLF